MRCSGDGGCLGNIRPGLEATKRVEFWRQPDGSLKVFGLGMAGGKLSEATGILEAAQHLRCYWALRKRGERGMGALPLDVESRLAELAAARASDPGYRPVPVADWREPETAAVEEMLPGNEGVRDN